VKARAQTRILIENSGRKNLSAFRLILDTIKDAKLVPGQAVQISQNGPYVFVVKPDNTVDMRPVKPGQPQDGDTVVIENGVQANETVVVSGQIALAPGVKVAPQPYKMSVVPAKK
jgi:multidrug efflux pump subunit AcrA (membrane-fusion protein)